MRVQPFTHLAVAGLLSLGVAGCTSDSFKQNTNDGADGSTVDTAPIDGSTVDTAPIDGSTIDSSGGIGVIGVIPSSPEEFSAPADAAALLAGLGFPSKWVLPDPLAAGDIVGVGVTLGLGSDGLVSKYSTTYRQPAGARADAVGVWAAKLDDVFDTDIAAASEVVNGTVTGNGLQGVLGGGGDENAPSGRFSLIAIGPEGNDKSPVVMRIKNERRDPNGTIAYTFPTELTDAIFDLAPCVPETVRVEYDAYDAPNASVEPPSYSISLDTNCDAGSFAAMATWANSFTAGPGMFVNVSDDRLSVSGLPAGAFTVEVSAGIADDGTVAVSMHADQPA